MSTISTTTPRNTNANILIASAIALIAILAFAVAPLIVLPQTAVIPVTGNQKAYVDFLRGEKTMYAESVPLNGALTAYRLGEQAMYANAVNSGNALAAWHLGEKTFIESDVLEAALLTWRQGEKRTK